jgi:serine protease AprX
LILLAMLGSPVQARVGPDLEQRLAAAGDGALAPVLFVLTDQLAADRLEQQVTGLPRVERRELVVRELKRHAAATQAGLRAELEMAAASGRVRKIEPLWLVNAIACEAAREIISELAGRADVRYCELALLVGDDVLGAKAEGGRAGLATGRAVRPDASGRDGPGIEWNVRRVGADSVWNLLGYQGDGVVVGTIDTGCNYDHADLARHMWSDPAYPFPGWDFGNNSNNPIDVLGHGTHVAGIVAGDGSAGDTCGIAPRARIMACRVRTVLSGPMPDTLAEDQVLAALQFCVAPPQAENNPADIVTMSLGWQLNWQPRLVLWRQALTNVTLAGVPVFVAAGNDRGAVPPPGNVRCPGNVPGPWRHPAEPVGGRGGAITVGASGPNDECAAFSSPGPVSWEEVEPYRDYAFPPGLFKPDVAAPGVGITSLAYDRNDGYCPGWSGTSMATPLVAGIAALMLERNPELLPAEIDSILQTTVRALGPQPKNNDFGTGRVSAYQAVRATPLNRPSHDLAVTGMSLPGGRVEPGAVLGPRLRIANLGTFDEAGVPVCMRIESLGVKVYERTEILAASACGAVDSLEFPNWRPGPGGNEYRVSAVVMLAADQRPENDSLIRSVRVRIHDVAASASNLSDRVVAGRSFAPWVRLENPGDYLEADFLAVCRIDSAGCRVYEACVRVESLGPGSEHQVVFPGWRPGPSGARYDVSLFHNLSRDERRNQDTLRRSVLARSSGLRVAIEIAQAAPGRTAPNACHAIEGLCREQNWEPVIVSGADLNSSEELAAYDVVVTGDDGNFGANDFALYDRALLEWVRSGGGFVGCGWLEFGIYYGPRPGSALDSLSPVRAAGNYGFVMEGSVVPQDSLHPVLAGVRGFPVRHYAEFGRAGLRTGAQALASYSAAPDQAAVACQTVGAGRSVYIGPILFADFAVYANEPYFDDVNARLLLKQAIEWAGAGPASGRAEPGPAGTEPHQPALEPIRPNPAQDRAGIGFTLPAAAAVKLAVYDQTGRRVAVLADRMLPAGRHFANWGCRTESDSRVPPGIYFCRLLTGSGSATRKLVVE